MILQYFIAEMLLKASELIEVTESGIVTEVRLVHL